MKKEILIFATLLLVTACGSTSGDKNKTDIAETNNLVLNDSRPDYGWVKLSFDITETGRTDNIKVIASSPPGYFDEEAIKALSNWIYKPQFVDGVPVRQAQKMVQLDFKVEEEN